MPSRNNSDNLFAPVEPLGRLAREPARAADGSIAPQAQTAQFPGRDCFPHDRMPPS